MLGDIDELLDEMKKKNCDIYGVDVTFNNHEFKQEDFFDNFLGYEDLKCNGCSQLIKSGKPRLKCIFC